METFYECPKCKSRSADQGICRRRHMPVEMVQRTVTNGKWDPAQGKLLRDEPQPQPQAA